ncbi:MAG: ABC transporter substrate-binding protein [Alphaproteobacteria bacterium]|nr:ABC transporter substrate-binding protein [Alphaproteobacteria bacterium]
MIAGSAFAAGALQAGFVRRAIAADAEPIRVGFLPALTGPSSSTGIAINRGMAMGVEEINAAGGVGGRKIDLITRDTQSDPTKAVNAATELTRREKAHVIFGPVNSGESLAATPLIARDGIPQLDPCWVDSLTDPKKYPLAFRNAPTNHQIGGAANRYVLEVMKVKKIAVIGDTTGYGTSSVDTYVGMLNDAKADVVYHSTIDAANPDLKPEILRMQSAGAEVIMPWSVNAGFLSRIINTRSDMKWDVAVVGQTTLGSGQTKALLTKPENWEKVYANNFRNCSYDASGKLPARTAAFVEKLKTAKVEMGDTLLWWIAMGYDAAHLIADTVKATGSAPDQIAGHWASLKAWPGVYGDLTWGPEQRNGFPDEEVVMVQANSFDSGAFKLAPGYGA